MGVNTGKLLIVDGSNLLFQMFYGMPSRIIGAHGKPVQGTLGFVGALLKIIRMTRPTHVIAVFDGECQNERKDIDPDYKANRPDYSEMPEEEVPFSQLPDIYAALAFLGIQYVETTVCETDDIIAAYTLTYKQDTEIVISSFDSDFFQLVDDGVSVLRYRGDNTVICDGEYGKERYGVEPCRYADYKAFVGDTADNIRGVRGVGPKTAAALIRDFGSALEILEKVEQISKPSVRLAVTESRDRVRMNLDLVTLGCKAEIPISMEKLAYTDGGYTTGDVLRAIGVK